MSTLVSALKTLLKLLVASAISLFVFLFAMGFADGPWGMVPGGAFSEASQPAPADWSFANQDAHGTIQDQVLCSRQALSGHPGSHGAPPIAHWRPSSLYGTL